MEFMLKVWDERDIGILDVGLVIKFVKNNEMCFSVKYILSKDIFMNEVLVVYEDMLFELYFGIVGFSIKYLIKDWVIIFVIGGICNCEFKG